VEGLTQGESRFHQQIITARTTDGAKALFASTAKEVIASLRNVAGFLSHSGPGYFHCEWVWSGRQVWIVQCDEALPPGRETDANRFISATEQSAPRFAPSSSLRHFREVTSDAWQKLRRPKLFERIGLPVADVYLLIGADWVNEDETHRAALLSDLSTMCRYPVVVRCDVSDAAVVDETLLPTSPAISDPAELVRFMNEVAAKFTEKGIGSRDWGFLLANLVPARASAMIHSFPGAQRVRIDALWGFPDGLLHFPHDSWFFYPNTRKAVEQRRYKGLCLLPKGKGWMPNKIGPPLDWDSVLSKTEIETLAKWGIKLANALGSEIQLMALARIGGARGAEACLPWHFTTWKVPRYSESLRMLPSSSRIEEITTSSDVDRLREASNSSTASGYLILPSPEYFRDDDFLKDAAALASQQRKPIYFEGSLLGHAYYIMCRTGAVVIPVTDDEPRADVTPYYKLVRDRIPVIIRKAGGLARVRHVPRSEATTLLMQKLIEEAFEVWNCEDQELVNELADVMEVIEGLRSYSGIARDELERVREEKRAKRGGFDQLTYLEETSVRSLKVQSENEGRLPLFMEDAEEPSASLFPSRGVRLEPSSNPRDITCFSVSLVPPVQGALKEKKFDLKFENIEVEARFSGNRLLVFVRRAVITDSLSQLTLFPDI